MSNSNSMVAHLWANQSKDSARSSNGNFHFSGRVIYSYRTPIGVHHPKCDLVTSNRYSVTTSGKHIPAIYRALGTSNVFYVPSLGEHGKPDHAVNLKHYQDAFAKAVKQWVNARDDRKVRWTSEHAAALADAMKEYAECFGLKGKAWFKPAADFADTREDVLAKRALRDTPERKAKRAKDQARRDAKRAEQDRLASLADAEKAAAWQSGALDYYVTGYGRPALLRVRGETLETSQGAEVPLDHAIRAFQTILACRKLGKTWERNGHSIHVGHFQVDSIDAAGNIKAGCHKIEWAEIERIARQLKLMEG